MNIDQSKPGPSVATRLMATLLLVVMSSSVFAEKLNNRSIQDYIRTAELMRGWQQVESTTDLNMVEGDGLNYTLAALKDAGQIWFDGNAETEAALDLAMILNQNGYANLFDYYDAGFAVASAYHVIRFGDEAGKYMVGLEQVDEIARTTGGLFKSFKPKFFGSSSNTDKIIQATQWAVSDGNLKAVKRNYDLVHAFFTPNANEVAAVSLESTDKEGSK